MPRPVVTPTTELMYEDLGAWTRGDEGVNWHLLKYMEAIGVLLQFTEDIARDKDGVPGWAHLFDPVNAPEYALEWAGQFSGVRFPIGTDVPTQRLLLQESPGLKRGTVETIKGSVRPYLTGARTVQVFEREGSPYAFRVRVYTNETPNPTAAEAAGRAAKPAGLVLTFQVTNGPTYTELNAAFTTYDAMNAALTTYDAQTYYVP